MNTNALVLSVALFALGLMIAGHAYARVDPMAVAIATQAAANRT